MLQPLFTRPPFKDREDAAYQLLELLKDYKGKDLVIASLLRGGYPIGKILAGALNAKHIKIAAAKIGAPFNPEVAVGAICFDQIYFNQRLIDELKRFYGPLYGQLINRSIKKAQEKLANYVNKFKLDPKKIAEAVQDKTVIVVDDGIATGATAYASAKFLKQAGAEQVILAAPVAPADFECRYFDECKILIRDPNFMAVGQYYEDFGEVRVEER